MAERLQKILAHRGVASRRQAEELIRSGRVAVGGIVVTELGTKVEETDTITVDGKDIGLAERKVYVLLNKPKGVITSNSDPEGRKTVRDLVEGVAERIYPVGRLDYLTEGLVILTNDGALAASLMHPSHEVEKSYAVTVTGRLTAEKRKLLTEGVPLADGLTAPARVTEEKVSTDGRRTSFTLTIHEGRNRQVRRMCEYVGLVVVALRRICECDLTLGSLAVGKWRYLTEKEVAHLKKVAGCD